MLQWSSKIGVAVIKQFNRGLCDPSAQLHDVGNHREYGLLGFFTALPFQTSLVNKQSGRRHVGGNLKFSTQASGAVEKSGVHRDNPPGCGLKKEMFFQWLQPWGLLLLLLRSFFDHLEMFQMFAQTTPTLPCRPCNCVLSYPRFRSWYVMNIFRHLNTDSAVSKISAKHEPGISFQPDPRRVSLSYPQRCFHLGLGEIRPSIFKLRLIIAPRKGVLWFISSSADELVTAVLVPDPSSGLVTEILFLVLH